MGCSPSKGRQNSSGSQGPFRTGRTLLPGSRESAGEPQLDGGGRGGSSCRGETDRAGGGGEKRSAVPPVLSQKDALGRGPSLTEVVLKGARPRDLGTHEIEINMIPRGTEAQGEASGKKGVRKSKKNKGGKPSRKKDKDRKAPAVEAKVDFPEPLVRAHQAAYAFLNPSIAKYEALLGLLEQAAQTHISLQPMATFMALRYEEVNCGLRETAEEGERLLKESGEHLAWPCPLKSLSDAPSPKVADAGEPPPDLLQQLLQYTAQRMRLVSRSVGGIGDSALEEAVEYFASLSELLDEKLKAKRALDARLGQVLARIESAALRRPGPEDSALYSEDSGIGAESESLAGSEHQRNRRESCESTSTARTGTGSPSARGLSLTGRMSTSISLTSLDSICTITAIETRDTESLLGSASLDDGEGEEEEDEEEEGDDEAADEQAGRKRSGSSPADPCRLPRRLPPKRIENPQNVEMTLKMKDAISGRIRFLHSQQAGARASKQAGGGGGPVNSGPQWTEEEEGGPQVKRPQTAAPSSARGPRKKASVAKERRSRSAESLRSRAEDPTLLELERTQKDLSQRLERMGKGGAGGAAQGAGHKRGGGEQAQAAHSPAAGRLSSSLDRNTAARPSRDKAARGRRSSGEHGPGSEEDEKKKKEKKAGKGPLRATPPPGTPPPSPSGFLRGRNSVKRLIDTFSQGLDGKRSQRTPELGPLRGVRKCGVPVMPGLEGGGEAPWGNNSPNSSGSCRVDSRASDRTEDLDLDSLPPPPPEVLMDTSFESAQGPAASESGNDVPARRGRSLLTRKTTATQRLRASVRPVTVLPSRNSLRRGSVGASPARPAHQDPARSEADPETEEAATLYQQARKIIHLRHSDEPPPDKPQADAGPKRSTPTRTRAGGRKGGGGPSDTVPSTPSVSSQPPGTPPASRARVLPSTPSTQHRRLPSPPTLKHHPTPPSVSSPPVNRNLPTPPLSGHRRLPSPVQTRNSVSPPGSQWKAPSPPASRRTATPNSSVGSYPLKAPSPPASPRVQRWTRENSGEEIVPLPSPATSRRFNNARSVFCPASPGLFEAQPCPTPPQPPQAPQAWASTGGCVLPRPWGESARGRLPASVRGPRPFVRRSHSDRRPSLTRPAQAPAASAAHSCGSEPSISTQGLEDGPTREEEHPWGSQSDLRAASRSASHPDLCIVGQALQR
ncbi:photoreceptor cilium actin regulator-like [Anguilla anguilla]|uniref:photoreceptor cilium actin regulator-like n=1 Tax=Anguilla anguilla TaxID=7936 RepID=UPI0015B20442|nr:photoreceptor cilium actin regulator-like [Anguilla anguilla]